MNLIGPKPADSAAVTHSEFVRALTQILKSKGCTVWTGAIKNVFGCIPGLRKAMYHKIAPAKEDFGEILADIHETSKFDLHIMDGIISIQDGGYSD